jgi:hypothetical protein
MATGGWTNPPSSRGLIFLPASRSVTAEYGSPTRLTSSSCKILTATVADKQEVVATGFGRSDTHGAQLAHLGPRGWLYGLNGVFNPVTSSIREKSTISPAPFRIHPRTREFQLFAEGRATQGVAWNEDGEAFLMPASSITCGISPSDYYHRQAGRIRLT